MKRFGFSTMPKCINYGHWFWYYEMMYLNKDGQHICLKCSEREHMTNIKITAEVNGKIVPLDTISTETFEAIKALEKPKEIPVPVARVGHYKGHPQDRRLFLKITGSIRQNVAKTTVDVIAIDLKNGDVNNIWLNNEEADSLSLYENVQPL